MSSREKVLALRAADPQLSSAAMAREIGVSPQRVAQILVSEGMATQVWRVGREKRIEYQCWWNMLDRCFNPASRSFKNYGARGITVCQRWRDFAKFFADLGPRPSALYSLDRINNNGNYTPKNCQWATRHDQNKNKRVKKRKRGASWQA